MFSLSIGVTPLVSVSSAANHVILPGNSRRVPDGTQTLTASVRDGAGKTGAADNGVRRPVVTAREGTATGTSSVGLTVAN